MIDYSSDLDAMDSHRLCRHIADQSGRLGVQRIDDFEEWYSQQNYPEDSTLTPVRMVLIGLGVDKATERMVNYLARSGVDISLATFTALSRTTGSFLSDIWKWIGPTRG